MAAGEPREGLRAGPWYGFGKLEGSGVLGLGEVLRAVELGKTDDLRSALRRLPREARRLLQVFFGIGAHAHLHEADFEAPAAPFHPAETLHERPAGFTSRIEGAESWSSL